MDFGAVLVNVFSIRRASIGDADTIAEIHVRAWRQSYAGLLPKAQLDGLSIERRARWWRGLLDGTDNPGGTAAFIVIDAQDQGIGFGSCGRQRDADLRAAGFDGEFETIYLLNDAKRRGIGRRLMATMAAAMLTEGFRGGALWVLEQNDQARCFYETLDGTVVGEREERSSGDLILQEVAYGWPNLRSLQSPAGQEACAPERS